MNDGEFKSMDQTGHEFKPAKKRQRKGVIKSDRHHLEGKLKLEPDDVEMETGVEFFQPIYEGDVVVGVIHRCSCGKTSEVRFQYGD